MTFLVLLIFLLLIVVGYHSRDIVVTLGVNDNINNKNNYLPKFKEILTKSGCYCDFPFEYNGIVYYDKCAKFNNGFFCKISIDLKSDSSNTPIKEIFITKQNEFYSECLENMSMNEFILANIAKTIDEKNESLYAKLYTNIKKEIENEKEEKLLALFSLSKNFCHESKKTKKDNELICLYENLIIPLSKGKNYNKILDKIIEHITSFKEEIKQQRENENTFRYKQYEFLNTKSISLQSKTFEKFTKLVKFCYGICNEECKASFDFAYEENFRADYQDEIKLEILSKLFLKTNVINSISDILQTNKTGEYVQYINSYYPVNEVSELVINYNNWSTRFTIFILYRYVLMNKNFYKEIIRGNFDYEKLIDMFYSSTNPINEDKKNLELLNITPLSLPYYNLSIALHERLGKIYENYGNITKELNKYYQYVNETFDKGNMMVEKTGRDVNEYLREMRKMVKRVDNIKVIDGNNIYENEDFENEMDINDYANTTLYSFDNVNGICEKLITVVLNDRIVKYIHMNEEGFYIDVDEGNVTDILIDFIVIGNNTNIDNTYHNTYPLTIYSNANNLLEFRVNGFLIIQQSNKTIPYYQIGYHNIKEYHYTLNKTSTMSHINHFNIHLTFINNGKNEIGTKHFSFRFETPQPLLLCYNPLSVINCDIACENIVTLYHPSLLKLQIKLKNQCTSHCSLFKWNINIYQCIISYIHKSLKVSLDSLMIKCGAMKSFDLVGHRKVGNQFPPETLIGQNFLFDNSDIKIKLEYYYYINSYLIRSFSKLDFITKFDINTVDQFRIINIDAQNNSIISYRDINPQMLFVKGFPNSFNIFVPYIYADTPALEISDNQSIENVIYTEYSHYGNQYDHIITNIYLSKEKDNFCEFLSILYFDLSEDSERGYLVRNANNIGAFINGDEVITGNDFSNVKNVYLIRKSKFTHSHHFSLNHDSIIYLAVESNNNTNRYEHKLAIDNWSLSQYNIEMISKDLLNYIDNESELESENKFIDKINMKIFEKQFTKGDIHIEYTFFDEEDLYKTPHFLLIRPLECNNVDVHVMRHNTFNQHLQLKNKKTLSQIKLTSQKILLLNTNFELQIANISDMRFNTIYNDVKSFDANDNILIVEYKNNTIFFSLIDDYSKSHRLNFVNDNDIDNIIEVKISQYDCIWILDDKHRIFYLEQLSDGDLYNMKNANMMEYALVEENAITEISHFELNYNEIFITKHNQLFHKKNIFDMKRKKCILGSNNVTLLNALEDVKYIKRNLKNEIFGFRNNTLLYRENINEVDEFGLYWSIFAENVSLFDINENSILYVQNNDLHFFEYNK